MAKSKACHCGAPNGTLRFECIACCVAWLLKMPDAETIRINAPAIRSATSEAHYNVVRQEFLKQRKG